MHLQTSRWGHKPALYHVKVAIAAGSDVKAARRPTATPGRAAHAPNVPCTSDVGPAHLAALFSHAALVVLTNSDAPDVLQQAGLYGKPLVAPLVHGFAERIADKGFAAEFFDPGDAQSLADAIATVLDDVDFRQELGLRNLLTARGLTTSDVVDWHLTQMGRIMHSKHAAATRFSHKWRTALLRWTGVQPRRMEMV